MVQTSLPWGGTVTGDAGPYTDDQWSDAWRKLLTRDRTLEGVLPNYLNELAVSNPAGVTIRVASGGAVVDGKFYDNSANVDFTGAVPGAGSNFYTVVLDKDFTAQTVRLAMLGPNAVSPPAVTQSDGTTWEIAIATVEITSGSVVTVTDARVYCHYNTEVSTAMLADLAVTGAKIADATIAAAKLIDGAGSGVDADLLDGVQGSGYTNTLQTVSATSDIVLTGTATLIPGMSVNLNTGQYYYSAFIPFLVQGSAGQYANINLQCFVDGVLQNGEGHDQKDIDDSGRDQLVTIAFAWNLVISGTQTVELRASYVTATATVTTRWQIDKAFVIKI